MSKFKVGQEVIFSKGDLKDVKGVVHNPFWQVSQSDWPEVIVEFYDEQEQFRSLFVDIDDVRPAEDPYEYNIETTDLITGHTSLFKSTVWEPDTEWLERKKEALDEYDKRLLNAGGELEYTRRLVKRRKAGRIEDV